MTTLLSINTATPADFDRAAATLTMAFANDPVLRWIFPDPHGFLTYFPKVVRAFGGPSLANGGAHYLEDFAGAALWLPPGVHADEEELGAALDGAVPEDRMEGMGAMMEQMAAGHPEEPHWYLFVIGVDPAKQRRGYGSILLQHGLEVCDRTRTIAYLESTNPDNTRLYQRHGFEAIGTIQAADSPVITRMLRRPR
jgi:ribosomal protein S18 acetylase RimI-like enzyme